MTVDLNTGDSFHFEVICRYSPESSIEPSIVILFIIAVLTITKAAFTSDLEIFDDLSELE